MVGFLPPDLSYFVDCALECNDITPDIYWYLTLFEHDPINILDNLSNFDFKKSHSHNLFRSCDTLEALIFNIKDSTAKRYLNAIGDSHINSCLKEVIGACSSDIFVNKEIPSKNEIIFSINKSFDKYFFDERLGRQKRAQKRNDKSISFQDAFNALHMNYNQRAKDIQQKLISTNHSDVIEWNDTALVSARRNNTSNLLTPLNMRTKKKTLKKSLALAESVISKNDVKMFLSGKEIIIEGQENIFKLTKTSALSNSHGGTKCSVFSKQNERQFDLCIYSEDAPVLDHLTSIYLHIKSGLESELLSIGNKYNFENETAKEINELFNRMENSPPFLLNYKTIIKRTFPREYKKIIKLIYEKVCDISGLHC